MFRTDCLTFYLQLGRGVKSVVSELLFIVYLFVRSSGWQLTRKLPSNLKPAKVSRMFLFSPKICDLLSNFAY